MDNLRAFRRYTTMSMIGLISFLPTGNLFANFPPKKLPRNSFYAVPYEIKFADITFQLSDATHNLIEEEVERLVTNRKEFQEKVERFSIFLPAIEPSLTENNVPIDFRNLLIYNKYYQTKETATNLDASIFWNFNVENAKDVDLQVDNQVDDRKHISTATKGFILFLKRNNILYTNWATVLFSCIADRKILQALEINKKWSNNQLIVLDNTNYTPILQFLAFKIALEREFPAYRPLSPKVLYEYSYGKGKTLQKISEELKVDVATLKENNQWFAANVVPDEDKNVLVITSLERFNQTKALAELTRTSTSATKELGFPVVKRNTEISNERGGLFYTINEKQGIQAELRDSPITLAYKAGVPLNKFLEFNDLNEKDILRVGWIYYLEKKNSKASVPYHIAQDDETLWEISQTYGVQLSAILGYNRLEKVQRLQKGRVVWIQTTRPKDKLVEYVQEKLPLEKTEIITEISTKNPLNVNESILETSNKTPFSVNIIEEKKAEIIANDFVKEPEKIVQKDAKLAFVEGNNVSKLENTKEVFVYHVVQKEETLYRISVNYSVSVDELKKLNNLATNIIEIGMRLKVKRNVFAYN